MATVAPEPLSGGDLQVHDVDGLPRAGREAPGGPRDPAEGGRQDWAEGGLVGVQQAFADGTNDLRDKVQDKVKQGVNLAVSLLTKRKEHQEDLAKTVPEVAVLLGLGRCENGIGSGRTFDLPKELSAAVDLEVSYYGKPQRLLVLRRHEPDGCTSLHSPAARIQDILRLVRECEATASGLAWPLHDRKVSEAILAMEAEELAYNAGLEHWPLWRRTGIKALRAIHLLPPSAERLATFQEHYGPGVDFLFSWSSFFVQQLWLLVIYAVVWMAVGVRSFRSTDDRWIYEVMKAGVVLWSVWVAFVSTWRYTTNLPGVGGPARTGVISEDAMTRELTLKKAVRRAKLLLVALPTLTVTVVMVLATFVSVTLLVLRVVFIWGDCINLHTEEMVCRDASVKHSVLGWAAEVACDVLLAVLFELFYWAGSSVSGWIAGLWKYDVQSDALLLKGMLELCLAAIERVGFVGCLAFLFVPQWTEPVCLGMEPLSACYCGDLLWGENDFRCFQRRLPVGMRRWVFESLMRGPFIVAPFINIIVKAIIPKVAGCLDRSCGRPLRRSRFTWLGPARGILRFMTLIFTYDSKRVGCLAFVCRGGPFAPLPPDLPEREVAEAALEQFKMKPFEVEEELLEIEMTLLWLVFFMPLLPGGVIVTMVAKLAEVNTDLTKLLFVNRRPVPVDDVAMRREISTYAWCVVVTGLAWTLGLSLVTYNDDLYKWGYGGLSVFLAMVAFMFAGSVAMTRTVKRCTVRSRFRRDVRVCPENPTGSAASAEDPGTCG